MGWRNSAIARSRRSRPASPRGRELLAEGLRHDSKEDMRKAARALREAIALRPNKPEAYYNLGAVLSDSEKTEMGWVEQVVLRAAMTMSIVLSREQAQELGHEGDALDSAKCKQMIKASRPWYMTFVRNNDAKGLKEWLKRAVNVLAANKWSKASACLNILVDELSELTIEQGFRASPRASSTTTANTWRCAACSPCSRTCRLTTQSCGAR